MTNRVIIWDTESSLDFIFFKNDTILIKDNPEESIQWIKDVASENRSVLPQSIYILKEGCFDYNIFIFAKYLQYNLNKTQILFATKQKGHNSAENIFILWEKIVMIFNNKSFIKNMPLIEVFETQLEKEPFFTKRNVLLYIFKLHQELLFSFFQLKFNEIYETTIRNQFSFPTKKNLKHQIKSLKSTIKQIEKTYDKNFLFPFQNSYKILNKIYYSKNKAEYLISLSSYIMILAKFAYSEEDYSKTIILCHRTLDLYFFYLQKYYQLPEEEYLIKKYNSLINNSKLFYESATDLSIKSINKCRNFSLYAHGDHSINKSIAKDVLNKTIKIITKIEGSQSLWTKFEKMNLMLKINHSDIFKFEYPFDRYFETKSF